MVTIVEADVQAQVAHYAKGLIDKSRLHLMDLMVPDGWVELIDLLPTLKDAHWFFFAGAIGGVGKTMSAVAAFEHYRKTGREVVIVSLPAGALLDAEEFGGLLAAGLKKLSMRATVFWAMNPSEPSVAALDRTMKVFARSPAVFVAARNLYFGPEDAFIEYASSEAKKALLKTGGAEVNIPKLDSVRALGATMHKKPIVPLSSDVLDIGVGLVCERWLGWMGEVFQSIDLKLELPAKNEKPKASAVA